MSLNQEVYRVIQWGTGAVGKYCIERTQKLSSLRQVGALVFSDEKDGQDVGLIAGTSPAGVKALRNKAAIYKTPADVVLYTPLIVDLDDICAILAEISQSADLLFGYLGFNVDGVTAATTPPSMLGIMQKLFEESMHMIAAGLGFEIERFRTSHDYAVTLEDSPTTTGIINKGHVGARHFRYEAMVGERTLIDFKLYWRMAKKLDPVWDVPMDGLRYIIEIEGEPGVRCSVEPVGDKPAELGVLATANLLMNAIPEVCRASPGFKTTLDMPLITAKSAITI
jgi:hypothetical protein